MTNLSSTIHIPKKVSQSKKISQIKKTNSPKRRKQNFSRHENKIPSQIRKKLEKISLIKITYSIKKKNNYWDWLIRIWWTLERRNDSKILWRCLIFFWYLDKEKWRILSCAYLIMLSFLASLWALPRELFLISITIGIKDMSFLPFYFIILVTFGGMLVYL